MTVEFNSMIIQISQSDDLDTLSLAVCVSKAPINRTYGFI